MHRNTLALVVAAFVLISVVVGEEPLSTDKRALVQTWLSGASQNFDELNTGTFGAWRGEPATIAGVWNDRTPEDCERQYALDRFKNWTGDMDNTVGGIWGHNETWEMAAAGVFETRWRNCLRAMDRKWLLKRTFYLRFAHEMNGNFMGWTASYQNATAFKSAWRLWYRLVQEELVAKGRSAKVVFGANDGSATNITALYPGDDVVDVIGVDVYDSYPVRTPSNWNQTMDAELRGPKGLDAWKRFAAAHGKPLSVPEWGLNQKNTTDSPFWMNSMNAWFRENAGTGPGQLLYEIYFNVWPQTRIFPSTNVPQSAATYRSLVWGLSEVSTVKPTTSTPSTVTPTTQKLTTPIPTTPKPTTPAPTTQKPSNAPTTVVASATYPNTATLSWQPPVSGGTIAQYRLGRDGFDSTGYGAWSAVVPSSARSQNFLALLPNTDYNVFVEAIFADGTTSQRVTLHVHTLSLTPKPTTPAPTTAKPTTPLSTILKPTTPTPTTAKPTTSAPTPGWASGASGHGSSGAFYTWRGEAGRVAGALSGGLDDFVHQWSLIDFKNWTGDVDIGLGAVYKNETWAQAANGAFDDRWRSALRSIYYRWNNINTVYLRFAYEFNSGFVEWAVSASSAAAFKASWARFYSLVQQELVLKGKKAKVVFGAHDDSTAPAVSLWPGNGYVDVVSVATNAAWPVRTPANWNVTLNATDSAGGPKGLDQWRLFAATHGKPFAVSDWRLRDTDNSFYIQKMNEWFRKHAGTTAGKLLYEIYNNYNWSSPLYPPGKFPTASTTYQALTWGLSMSVKADSADSASTSSHHGPTAIAAIVVVPAVLIGVVLAVIVVALLGIRTRKQSEEQANYRFVTEK